MKAQLGKPTGLALALLAALLATFFAMGVFSVAQAQTPTHSASRSFSATTVAPGGEVVVTINVSGYGNYGVVEETLPTGFSYVDSNGADGFVRGALVEFLLIGGSVNSFTYTVTASDTEGSYRFDGDFETRVEGADISVDISGATTVTVAAATNGGNGDGTDEASPVTLSSQEPGAAVRIEIEADAGVKVPAGEDINIKLKSFDLPDTISESHVLFSDGDAGAADSYTGNPSEARISGGDTIILTVPSTLPNGEANPKGVTGRYKIVIKQSAGITNPTAGGMYTVEVDDMDADVEKPEVQINRVVKLSATSGTRGTETTATFKGFANGSATVFLNDPNRDDPNIGPDASSKHGEVMITDNTGTLEIDTTSSSFKANQDNTITAQDAAGNDQDVSATLTISAKAVVDPEESPVSKEVTINLSDWPATNPVTKVTIGSSDVTPSTTVTTDDDGSAEFKVMVPAGANRGTQTVKVTGTEVDDSTPSATASLNVGVLALTIQPTMVVPGQQITIQGSGFKSGDKITMVEIGNQTADVEATANSAGNVVISVNAPSDPDTAGIGSGKKTVSVSADGVRADGDASSGRVAEGEIELHEPAITLSPETSRRGTTVSVSGSGFPSGDLVQIKYTNNDSSVTVAAGSADASGAVSIDFTVPSYANIGAKHDVEATSVGIFKGVTAKATHETPGATVTLSSDSVASGENITITGLNFPAFATVAVMEIGGVDVRPVPAPATSIDGDFTSTVLVPQKELGNQTVSIRVSQTTITTFLELVTVTVSRAPADVFASLGDRLVRVWYLERSTQVWSFYDPDSDVAAFNTLTEVSSGQNVSIIISSGANIGFQDKTLYPGTNPIALD